MQLSEEMKAKLKEQRLAQYRQQAFVLQMDLAALEAVGDSQKAAETRSALEDVQKAYTAVEVL